MCSNENHATLLIWCFLMIDRSISVTILAWCVSVGLTFYKQPKPDQTFLCFIYSININGAFKLSVNEMTEIMNRRE